MNLPHPGGVWEQPAWGTLAALPVLLAFLLLTTAAVCPTSIQGQFNTHKGRRGGEGWKPTYSTPRSGGIFPLKASSMPSLEFVSVPLVPTIMGTKVASSQDSLNIYLSLSYQKDIQHGTKLLTFLYLIINDHS